MISFRRTRQARCKAGLILFQTRRWPCCAPSSPSLTVRTRLPHAWPDRSPGRRDSTKLRKSGKSKLLPGALKQSRKEYVHKGMITASQAKVKSGGLSALGSGIGSHGDSELCAFCRRRLQRLPWRWRACGHRQPCAGDHPGRGPSVRGPASSQMAWSLLVSGRFSSINSSRKPPAPDQIVCTTL